MLLLPLLLNFAIESDEWKFLSLSLLVWLKTQHSPLFRLAHVSALSTKDEPNSGNSAPQPSDKGMLQHSWLLWRIVYLLISGTSFELKWSVGGSKARRFKQQHHNRTAVATSDRRPRVTADAASVF